MAATGERALRYLHDLHGRTPARALRQLPFLIPLTSQCTLAEPLHSIFEHIEHDRFEAVDSLDFTPGFPAADVPECGPAVFAYGTESEAVSRAVTQLAQSVLARENEFALEVHSIEAALWEIARTPIRAGHPVVLADTQDNPGGGGTASTTSLIKALSHMEGYRILAGILFDPAAAAHAHAAGLGASIDLALGAQFDDGARVLGESPMNGRFKVLSLGDGMFTGTGPFYRGARMNLGPMALLRSGQLHIAIASRKQQAADQAMFRHVGAEPSGFDVLALKSSVHFRADFGSIAQRVLVVIAQGPNIANPATLPFKKLRAGVRVF
jgi:microcystin degradation protein MlrC